MEPEPSLRHIRIIRQIWHNAPLGEDGRFSATGVIVQMKSRNVLSLSAAGLLIFLSGGIVPAPLWAQEANGDGLAALAKAFQQKTDVPPAADFVQKSRGKANQQGFIPVHAARSQPKGKPLSGDQIRAREAELQQVLTRNAALAEQRPPTLKGQSAAGAKKAAKTVRKPPAAAPCILTCQIK